MDKTENIEFGSLGKVKVSRVETRPLDTYAKWTSSQAVCPSNPGGPTFDDDTNMNPGLCLVS